MKKKRIQFSTKTEHKSILYRDDAQLDGVLLSLDQPVTTDDVQPLGFAACQPPQALGLYLLWFPQGLYIHEIIEEQRNDYIQYKGIFIWKQKATKIIIIITILLLLIFLSSSKIVANMVIIISDRHNNNIGV